MFKSRRGQWRGEGWGLSVEQCCGVMKEAVSEPGGSTSKAPVKSPRWEHGEQSVTGVCVVLDDVVCSPQTPG